MTSTAELDRFIETLRAGRTVLLGSGGLVTITYDVAEITKLSDADREFVRSMARLVLAFVEQHEESYAELIEHHDGPRDYAQQIEEVRSAMGQQDKRAALWICGRSESAAEARDVLEMLGLIAPLQATPRGSRRDRQHGFTSGGPRPRPSRLVQPQQQGKR